MSEVPLQLCFMHVAFRGRAMHACIQCAAPSLSRSLSHYRGTSPTRKRTPRGPYRRPMPRVQGGPLGGWALSYGRGTPASIYISISSPTTCWAQWDTLPPPLRPLQPPPLCIDGDLLKRSWDSGSRCPAAGNSALPASPSESSFFFFITLEPRVE